MAATSEGWKKRRQPTVEAYIKSKTKRVGKCLIWQGGSANPNGEFNYDGEIGIPSRKVYEHRVGKIAKGKCILHKCDTPRCVDGRHLYQGTKKQNRADFMKRHPRARALCLEASKVGAAGVQRFWDKMTPRRREAFVKRRRDKQAALGAYKGGKRK